MTVLDSIQSNSHSTHKDTNKLNNPAGSSRARITSGNFLDFPPKNVIIEIDALLLLSSIDGCTRDPRSTARSRLQRKVLISQAATLSCIRIQFTW